MSEQLEVRLRDLATYERFRIALHDLGFHYTVSTVGCYSSPNPKLDPLYLFNALQHVINQHPALTLQIRGRNGPAPYFIRLPQLYLSKVVEFRDVEEHHLLSEDTRRKVVENLLSEQNSKGFNDEYLPLWRIIVLNLGASRISPGFHQHAIAFIWHHIIADGKSGQAMHYAILQGLNSTSAHKLNISGACTMIPSTTPLLPSMDEVFSYPTSWSAWFQKLFGRLLPRGYSPSRRWTGAPHHFENNPKTLIRLIELSKPVTFTLLALSRKNKTSMTAFLQAIVGMVLFEHLPEAEQLRCSSAIELRRFLPKEYGIDETKIGLWIDGWQQDFQRGNLVNESARRDGVSWNEARRNKTRIDYEISKGQSDLSFGALRGISDFKPGLLGMIGNVRENSYSIVNLGLCAGASKDDDHWKLDTMVISQSAHVNGSAIQFCVVSTRAGGMTISLNWQEGTVTEEFVDSIVGDLKQRLVSLGNCS